jgi:hypothetical protein
MLPMTALSTDPLIMPMPVIEPTETCVVETGIPRRLARITMKAVTRLAVSAWPSFILDIFLLMVTATLWAFSQPPIAIATATANMLT